MSEPSLQLTFASCLQSFTSRNVSFGTSRPICMKRRGSTSEEYRPASWTRWARSQEIVKELMGWNTCRVGVCFWRTVGSCCAWLHGGFFVKLVQKKTKIMGLVDDDDSPHGDEQMGWSFNAALKSEGWCISVAHSDRWCIMVPPLWIMQQNSKHAMETCQIIKMKNSSNRFLLVRL